MESGGTDTRDASSNENSPLGREVLGSKVKSMKHHAGRNVIGMALEVTRRRKRTRRRREKLGLCGR